MPVTREQLAAGLETLKTMAEIVRLKQTISAGELYALTMNAFDSITAFDKALAMLVNSTVISRTGDVLTWNV